MAKNLLQKWRENTGVTPQDVLESDMSVNEIRSEVADWSISRQLEFLISLLREEERRTQRNSINDRAAQAIASAVVAVRAKKQYKERLRHLKN